MSLDLDFSLWCMKIKSWQFRVQSVTEQFMLARFKMCTLSKNNMLLVYIEIYVCQANQSICTKSGWHNLTAFKGEEKLKLKIHMIAMILQ